MISVTPMLRHGRVDRLLSSTIYMDLCEDQTQAISSSLPMIAGVETVARLTGHRVEELSALQKASSHAHFSQLYMNLCSIHSGTKKPSLSTLINTQGISTFYQKQGTAAAQLWVAFHSPSLASDRSQFSS